MPIINFSKADLLGGELIPPGWYKVEVLSLVVKTPKSGSDSLNYVPRFRICEPGKPQDGMEIPHTFNSQALGRMTPFLSAIQERPVKVIAEEIKDGNLAFDTDDAVGKKLQIQIHNEPWDGRMVNKVINFAAWGAAPAF